MMQGKIALEEHFFLPSFAAYGADPSPLDGATKAHNYVPAYFADVQKRLGDGSLRLRDMDRCGIECMVLSLTQPGIQSIPDRAIAVETAKRMNDDLAEHFLSAHPNRFAGFAAVALQDVSAAGDELQRAISKLGFKGVMINGYTNIGDMNTAQYLDEPPVWDFGPAWKHLMYRSTCIPGARYLISGECTRDILSWRMRLGVSGRKQPCIRFV
jgi:gamma-resorcylate decarboxylase